jgi:hypothetical protein
VSRPLLPKRERVDEAAKFHKAVFAMWGNRCVWCPKVKRPATDAAHVIARALLGPLRYADPGLARPAHRECHDRQTNGEIVFPIAVRRAAVRCHNKIAKVKLQIP